MRESYKSIDEHNYVSVFNSATKIKEDTLNGFKLGVLGLQDRAKIEDIYWKTLKKV